MTGRRYTALIFSLFLIALPHCAYAGDKTISIYTPFTFSTTARPSRDHADDTEIVKCASSDGKFGIGVNYGFKKNASLFLEKLAVGDSSKDIYISGIKFDANELLTRSISEDSLSKTALKNNDVNFMDSFVAASYILGISRITQDEKKSEIDSAGKDIVTFDRHTGYNFALGAEFLSLNYSYVHVVPLRIILTVGQSGTSVFVSSEAGFSLPWL